MGERKKEIRRRRQRRTERLKLRRRQARYDAEKKRRASATHTPASDE